VCLSVVWSNNSYTSSNFNLFVPAAKDKFFAPLFPAGRFFIRIATILSVLIIASGSFKLSFRTMF